MELRFDSLQLHGERLCVHTSVGYVLSLDIALLPTDLASYCAQAAARASLGEGVTAFDKMSDGNRVVQKGDIVHLALKPAVVGRVLFFSVDKVCLLSGRVVFVQG